MEDAIIKAVGTYGILGLGWLLFVYVLKLYIDLHEKVMEAFVQDTAMKVTLNGTLGQLIEAVKGR